VNVATGKTSRVQDWNSHIEGWFPDSSTAASPHEIASCHTNSPSTTLQQRSRRSRGEGNCICGETNEQRIRSIREKELDFQG
jgi:hypothetical protein